MAVGGKGARPADWPGARPHVWGCGGVGQCCCGGVAWVVEGFAYERGVSWCFGDVRQTRVMERFTRCGSNALDGEAMH